jgi:hypothetical protein
LGNIFRGWFDFLRFRRSGKRNRFVLLRGSFRQKRRGLGHKGGFYHSGSPGKIIDDAYCIGIPAHSASRAAANYDGSGRKKISPIEQKDNRDGMEGHRNQKGSSKPLFNQWDRKKASAADVVIHDGLDVLSIISAIP